MGLQLGGLGSGADTTAIIEQLLAVERRPIALYRQRKDAIQVKYDVWKDVATRLGNLLSKLADLKLAAVMKGRVVRSGNEAVATGTADTTAAAGTYSLVVTQLAQAHRVASDRQADATSPLNSLIPGFNGGTVQINGQTVVISATDSLTSLAATINGTANIGVTASVVDNRLVITRNATGATAITFADDGTNKPLEKLGILTTQGTIKNELVAPADAAFSIDGQAITRSVNTVTDVLPGVTLHLNGVSPKDAAGNWVPTRIEVAQDVDKAVAAVKAFVEQYNSVYEFIQSKLAKGGALQGDTALGQLQVRLRSDVSGVVSGRPATMNQLWQIGLDVAGGVAAAKGGTLVVDEAKLRQAITADPDGVYQLFSQAADGIAVRLEGHLNLYTRSGGTIEGVQKTLQMRMDFYAKQIEALEKRVALVREQLVRQFTAMEKALASLKNQGNWLAAQIQQMGRS